MCIEIHTHLKYVMDIHNTSNLPNIQNMLDLYANMRILYEFMYIVANLMHVYAYAPLTGPSII